MLKLLIVRDGKGSPGARCRRGALATQRALSARDRVELDDVARDERLDLARGASDGARAHVDREVALSEDLPVARDPGLAKYLAAAREDLGCEGTVDVAAVDRQLADGVTFGAALDIGLQSWNGFDLGTICRGDPARKNQFRVEVARDVALVAVEALGLALAPVAHVLVLDRYAPVFGGPLADARLIVGRVRVEVLLAQLPQRRERLGERRIVGVVAEDAFDPLFESVQLLDELSDGRGLLRRVTPLEIERGFDAGPQEQRCIRVLGDLLGREVRQLRRAGDHLACCVREQVEGVFDPAGSFQGARIDGHSDLFRKLLPVECRAATGQLDGALEKATIHVVRDQTLAECRQRAL